MPLRPGPNAKSPRSTRKPIETDEPRGFFGGIRAFFAKTWVKWTAIASGVTLAGLAITGLAFWHYLFHDLPSLPDAESLWATGREPAIEYRASDDSLIEIRGPRYGRAVKLEDLPIYVPGAFIAAEDKRFYEHKGMDAWAIARALWANVRAGETVQGGSTLTQQLVKNLVLTPEQTYKRKAQEIVLAQKLEKRLKKDEILELYLNRVYLGAQAYGVDAASRTYFNKPASELTIAEASLLATLPKAPSRLALTDNMDGARARQAYVLKEMVSAGYITAEDAEAARAEEVELASIAAPSQYGYALDMASARARELVPNMPNDAVVTLTVRPALQAAAHDALEKVMAEKGEPENASQAAAVFMKPSGEILVLIGGRDYSESQFNRATQGLRQPGSAFKLFVFLTALEEGLGPFDVREDEPVEIGKWKPSNYNDSYLGPVTLTEAFSKSLNTVAANLGQELGQERVIATARRLGITTPMDSVPSIVLGTSETTLVDMTRAYGALANGGRKVTPFLISKIEDTRGNILYEANPDAEDPVVVKAEPMRQMNAMLIEVVRSGTGHAARLDGWVVAGKTGTSQDWRDAWFIGFTSDVVGGVWVGNDDNSPMKRVTGGSLPAEIWASIAALALEGETPDPLPGQNIDLRMSPDVQGKIVFYRDLSTAFREVESRG